MRIIAALSFVALTGFSLLLTFYLILLGMAPMVPRLDYTGFVIYGPGPGFFLLMLELVVMADFTGLL